MIIELYTAPKPDWSGHAGSPISNTTGELPEQEPALNLGDLLGSFDSREEAIDFITNRLADSHQTVSDTQTAPFNAYTHVEWLTVTCKTADQSIQHKSYYLVTDEGY